MEKVPYGRFGSFPDLFGVSKKSLLCPRKRTLLTVPDYFRNVPTPEVRTKSGYMSGLAPVADFILIEPRLPRGARSRLAIDGEATYIKCPIDKIITLLVEIGLEI